MIAPTTSSAISIRGLSVSYGVKRILTNIHLECQAGRIHGVIGPNGAGKSTLFKSILGLIDINAGQVLVLGHDIKDVRGQVAYIPQRDDIDWDFPATVSDVVMMGRHPHRRIWQSWSNHDRDVAYKAMERLKIAHLRDRQIGALSGGQQQRVFIARAICQEARILLLDEPFVGVDLTTERNISSILKELASQGITILLVHHDLSTVSTYFTDVIMLNRRLIAAGPVETHFTDELVSKTFGAQLDILHRTNELGRRDGRR